MKTIKIGLILLISILATNSFAQGYYNQTGIEYLNKDSVVPGDTITMGIVYWNAGSYAATDSTILYMQHADPDSLTGDFPIRITSYTVAYLLALPIINGYVEIDVVVPDSFKVGLARLIFGIGDKQWFWVNDTTTVDTTDTTNTATPQIGTPRKEIESVTYFDILGRPITQNSLIRNNLYIFVTRYRGGSIESKKVFYHGNKD